MDYDILSPFAFFPNHGIGTRQKTLPVLVALDHSFNAHIHRTYFILFPGSIFGYGGICLVQRHLIRRAPIMFYPKNGSGSIRLCSYRGIGNIGIAIFTFRPYNGSHGSIIVSNPEY